jgi:hypothetical protein
MSSLEGGAAGGAQRVAEGERLLPQQQAGEAAGVAAALALQLLVNAVVHHKDVVELAGHTHLPHNLAGVIGELDERHVRLLCCVRGRLSSSGQMKCCGMSVRTAQPRVASNMSCCCCTMVQALLANDER